MKPKMPTHLRPTSAQSRVMRSWILHLLHAALEAPPLRKRLDRRLRETHAHLAIEAHFLTRAQSRRLNRDHLQKDAPTDVLSFPAPEWGSLLSLESQELCLGELLICLPVLKQQAREHRHSEADELRLLLTHGFLHLLGMDHEASPRAAREMARWERTLLHSGGLKDPESRSLITRASMPMKRAVKQRKKSS